MGNSYGWRDDSRAGVWGGSYLAVYVGAAGDVRLSVRPPACQPWCHLTDSQAHGKMSLLSWLDVSKVDGTEGPIYAVTAA